MSRMIFSSLRHERIEQHRILHTMLCKPLCWVTTIVVVNFFNTYQTQKKCHDTSKQRRFLKKLFVLDSVDSYWERAGIYRRLHGRSVDRAVFDPHMGCIRCTFDGEVKRKLPSHHSQFSPFWVRWSSKSTERSKNCVDFSDCYHCDDLLSAFLLGDRSIGATDSTVVDSTRTTLQIYQIYQLFTNYVITNWINFSCECGYSNHHTTFYK